MRRIVCLFLILVLAAGVLPAAAEKAASIDYSLVTGFIDSREIKTYAFDLHFNLNPLAFPMDQHLKMAGYADFLKDNTKRYTAALRRAGHPCKLVYYEDNRKLTHAFPALKPELPESRNVLDQLVEWIAAVV